MIDSIEIMAKGMSANWDGYFAPNELVNEAWIRSLKSKVFSPALIIRRAKLDMIDYIRRQMGREYLYVDGKKIRKGVTSVDGKEIKKGIIRPKYYTGFHDLPSRVYGLHGHYDNIFDRPIEDKGLLRLEDTELIVKLLLDHTTTQRAEAMLHYYLEEHDLKEAGVLMEIKECTISTVLKKGRADCHRILEVMQLVEA